MVVVLRRGVGGLKGKVEGAKGWRRRTLRVLRLCLRLLLMPGGSGWKTSWPCQPSP